MAGRPANPGPPEKYTTGSGAGFGAPVCRIATGIATVRPSGFERSSGTVSVPHSMRASWGTSSVHGPFAYTGVYAERATLVADGEADVPDEQAVTAISTSASDVPFTTVLRHDCRPWVNDSRSSR